MRGCKVYLPSNSDNIPLWGIRMRLIVLIFAFLFVTGCSDSTGPAPLPFVGTYDLVSDIYEPTQLELNTDKSLALELEAVGSDPNWRELEQYYGVWAKQTTTEFTAHGSGTGTYWQGSFRADWNISWDLSGSVVGDTLTILIIGQRCCDSDGGAIPFTTDLTFTRR